MNTDAIDGALWLYQLAWQRRMLEMYADAEALCRRSLQAHQKAETYTLLGEVLSLQDDLFGAIEACERAIIIAPDFGEPYNNIGAYMMIAAGLPRGGALADPAAKVNRVALIDAIPYLESAMDAPRNPMRHYPYFNMGRIMEAIGEWPEALAAYRESARIAPYYVTAAQAVGRLRAWMQ